MVNFVFSLYKNIDKKSEINSNFSQQGNNDLLPITSHKDNLDG